MAERIKIFAFASSHSIFQIRNFSFLGSVIQIQLIQSFDKSGASHIINFLDADRIFEFVDQFPQQTWFVRGEKVSERFEQICPVFTVDRNVSQVHVVSVSHVHVIIQNFLFDRDHNSVKKIFFGVGRSNWAIAHREIFFAGLKTESAEFEFFPVNLHQKFVAEILQKNFSGIAEL